MAFVWKLKLKGPKEWWAWCKSDQRPDNIPSTPNRSYRDDGWISLPDWLGYGSEGGASDSGSSSSSSSSSATTQKNTKKKTKKKKKTVAPQPPPPPPRGNTNGGARAASGPESDSDDDIISSSSSGPPQTKVNVEMVDDFLIVSADSDLTNTACGLIQHGAPTS